MKNSWQYYGVVEGFYGQMWTHEERMHLVRHLKQWNMNMYIYAPRDDPYHRYHWDKPYPAREMKQFTEIAKEACRQGVMFSYAISPGCRFSPDKQADYLALVSKLKPFIELGCTFFPIFYDDRGENFEPDSESGVRTAEMQAKVMNTLTADVRAICPEARFLFAPTQYMTAEKSPYLCRLHELLDSSIETAVSGVDPDTDTVCPRTFSDAGARRYLDHFGRRPFFWDNFNVRDNALTVLHWSPYSGRGRNLHRICSGIMLNPQNVYLLNIPIFGCMGDYLADPEHYDPQSSFRRHLIDFMGKEAAPLGEELSRWYTSEWFARSGDGFVSSENNLPSLETLKTIPIGKNTRFLAEVTAALAPMRDFGHRFQQAVMPPDVAACLIPYAHILSDYADAMVVFCHSLQEQKSLPEAAEELHNRIRFIEDKMNYPLPISITAWTRQLLGAVASGTGTES